jgi:hypothetical protein
MYLLINLLCMYRIHQVMASTKWSAAAGGASMHAELLGGPTWGRGRKQGLQSTPCMHVVAGACTAVVNAMQGTTGGMGSDDRSIQFQWMDTDHLSAYPS